ncbi:MAG TPA: ABC transporter permease [Candidatus Saccharimonadales bacterium]|nr:ABC transporter permease [Candidatus Saccharimonadales bacterium]
MSLWSRIVNAIRGEQLNREISEEMESHIAEAVEQGRDPDEARRALGRNYQQRQQREASYEIRTVEWLELLRADVTFGWKQLKRNKVTSIVAILSLALAMGACIGAFRLMDALLWRPLPVAHAERLYALSRQAFTLQGKPIRSETWAYPSFSLMRDAVKDQAELIAVSPASRKDLTYGSDEEMEKANVQYVSGSMLQAFGLRPAIGRLLTENDDQTPGAHPYVVLSYDYWTQRFGKDPQALGRTLRIGKDLYQITGVVDEPFTGTEPGTMTDIFLPAMMHPSVTRSDATSVRTLVLVKPGTALEPLRQKLSAVSRAFEEERAKGFTGAAKIFLQKILDATLLIEPAGAGISSLQDEYRKALGILGALVALVLLIACVNVANLKMAQSVTRSREMALRVAIGAGRSRLVQMLLVENAMLAVLAAGLGALFAWQSAPLVVTMIQSSDSPVRLLLYTDWRVLGFGVGLVFCVLLLFGVLPALRASTVKPVSALKGGDDDPHSRRHLMHGMIAAQVAVCFLVIFVSGLFVRTFESLSNKPLGFSPERLLLLDVVAQQSQPPVVWDQIADNLRTVPGVERVAIAGWPLLSGGAWNNFVSVGGGSPSPIFTYLLAISPGWPETMKIPLLDGRDLRPGDTTPGQALVNQSFVKTFLDGKNPIGKTFQERENHYQVVGLVADAPYGNLRDAIVPVAYIPFHEVNAQGVAQPESQETFLVRTSGSNPLALASVLRKAIPQAHAGFRVTDLRTQSDLVRAQTVRERLLAMLAAFFSFVALLLAAIGLYGVLSYSVQQREREFGIRIAVGAGTRDIAWHATSRVFLMVVTGAVIGAALGIASVRYVETLLYGVTGTDPVMLTGPAVALLAIALLSALPVIVRASRIDPKIMLRAE